MFLLLHLCLIFHCVGSAGGIQIVDDLRMRKGGLNRRESLYLKALGGRLRKMRTSKGYSQDRLCLEASFSRGTIYKIEQGHVNSQILTLAKIAKTLCIPLGKLLDLDF
jgi:DNA-binding XRE family transcriptional regulator